MAKRMVLKAFCLYENNVISCPGEVALILGSGLVDNAEGPD